jgi:hypothetical protein
VEDGIEPSGLRDPVMMLARDQLPPMSHELPLPEEFGP